MKIKFLLIISLLSISCAPAVHTQVQFSKPAPNNLIGTRLMLQVFGTDEKRINQVEEAFQTFFKRKDIDLELYSKIFPSSQHYSNIEIKKALQKQAIRKILFVGVLESKRSMGHYELALSDVRRGKVLWRAAANSKSARIKSLAVEIFNQLDKAGYL